MEELNPFIPIAYIKSVYKEKFATPRQPGLSSAAKASIEFTEEFSHLDFVKGLESFSHIWVVFIFHQHTDKKYNALVRPPRLGGEEKVGVFASRSPYRPNPIGLSVVKLDNVVYSGKRLTIEISGADIIDGSPVIDIKPYIQYADSIKDAVSGYAEFSPEKLLTVDFSEQSKFFLSEQGDNNTDWVALITETLQLDPRPAYDKTNEKVYGIHLHDYNIKWSVVDNVAHVIEIKELL